VKRYTVELLPRARREAAAIIAWWYRWGDQAELARVDEDFVTC
jgi:hypothetical protein